MPGAPTPAEGTHWRSTAESVLSRYHFLSSAACHPQLQVSVTWETAPDGLVSSRNRIGKFRQCGNLGREAQAR